MKESFNYENRTGELKKSLSVGINCVGIVGGSIYKEIRPIAEYRLNDAVHRWQRKRVALRK